MTQNSVKLQENEWVQAPRKRGLRPGSAGLIALAFTMLLAGCNQSQGEGETLADVVLPAVTVAEVTQGKLTTTTQLSGKVSGSVEVTLVPKLAGRAVELPLSVGDAVSAGDLVVALEPDDMKTQVAQAQAGLAAAQAGLEQAKSGADQQLTSAEAGLAQATGGVKQAQVQLEVAQSAYEDAKLNLERTQQLQAAGAASVYEVQQAELNLQNRESSLTQAQVAYESAQANEKAAQESYSAAQRKTAVKTAQAQVAQAQAGLQAARQQLENTRITAPVSGVLAALNVEKGEMVSPSTLVATIVQLDPAQVTVNLPEGLFSRVSEGQEVDVAVQENVLKGRVVRKDLTINAQTNAYTIKIEVPNSEGILASGMTANVSFTAEESAESTLLIPTEAYTPGVEAGKGSVMVYRDGAVEKREIAVGKTSSRQVAVLEGLQAGEQVVTKGQHLLKDGDQVEVVQPHAADAASEE